MLSAKHTQPGPVVLETRRGQRCQGRRRVCPHLHGCALPCQDSHCGASACRCSCPSKLSLHARKLISILLLQVLCKSFPAPAAAPQPCRGTARRVVSVCRFQRPCWCPQSERLCHPRLPVRCLLRLGIWDLQAHRPLLWSQLPPGVLTPACRMYAFDVHCNSYFPLFILLYGEAAD